MQQIDHSKSIIELKDVSFSYGEEPVIADVNLQVHKGDYLGIIGPNGGGKSTLLKLMLGLLTPTEGEVCLYGSPINKFRDWSKVGYVSQHVTHIDPHFPMTVEEVVMMGRYPQIGLFRFPMQKDRDIVKDALSQVEMVEFENRLV